MFVRATLLGTGMWSYDFFFNPAFNSIFGWDFFCVNNFILSGKLKKILAKFMF